MTFSKKNYSKSIFSRKKKKKKSQRISILNFNRFPFIIYKVEFEFDKIIIFVFEIQTTI